MTLVELKTILDDLRKYPTLENFSLSNAELMASVKRLEKLGICTSYRVGNTPYLSWGIGKLEELQELLESISVVVEEIKQQKRNS